MCDRCELKYRPDNPVDEWFSEKLPTVAQTCGIELVKLWGMLCSDDPVERAWGYDEIIAAYGAYEFDFYPDTFTEEEADERIGKYLTELKEYERG